MKKATTMLVLVSLAVMTSWAFLGIERVPDEHSTQYNVFAKQRPTFRVFFRNPTTCGVCDLHPYEQLTEEDKAEFAQFCKYRFGLDRSSECYAIFVEQQNQAQSRLQKHQENPRSRQ